MAAAGEQCKLPFEPLSVPAALPLCLLQGGATAAIPGAVLVNDCTGPDYSQTSGVAACSYIRVRLLKSRGRKLKTLRAQRGKVKA